MNNSVWIAVVPSRHLTINSHSDIRNSIVFQLVSIAMFDSDWIVTKSVAYDYGNVLN